MNQSEEMPLKNSMQLQLTLDVMMDEDGNIRHDMEFITEGFYTNIFISTVTVADPRWKKAASSF